MKQSSLDFAIPLDLGDAIPSGAYFRCKFKVLLELWAVKVKDVRPMRITSHSPFASVAESLTLYAILEFPHAPDLRSLRQTMQHLSLRWVVQAGLALFCGQNNQALSAA